MNLKFLGQFKPVLPTLRELLNSLDTRRNVTFIHDGFIYAVLNFAGRDIGIKCHDDEYVIGFNLRSQSLRRIKLDTQVELVEVEVNVKRAATHRYVWLEK